MVYDCGRLLALEVNRHYRKFFIRMRPLLENSPNVENTVADFFPLLVATAEHTVFRTCSDRTAGL